MTTGTDTERILRLHGFINDRALRPARCPIDATFGVRDSKGGQLAVALHTARHGSAGRAEPSERMFIVHQDGLGFEDIMWIKMMRT